MVRNRKRKSLYEVIGKTVPKPACDDRSEEKLNRTDEIVPNWPKKPKIMQFNVGRIEISLPYQLAIAILLGVILLFLVVYRLGQNNPVAIDSQLETVSDIPRHVQSLPALKSAESDTAGKLSLNVEENEQSIGKGNNRIVIKQYHLKRDLEPVQRYFAANGIETEIKERNNGFFLQTKNDTYENPKRAGTDGNVALNKIIRVGAGYKAPQGYESFAPKMFSDAYGEKAK